MKAILTFVAALAFALVPFAVPFGGFDPTAYPVPQFEPEAQPATYAFGIWGLIYFWLVVSASFGLFRRAENAEWDAVRWPLFGSLVIGAAWLPVARMSPVWALILIWAMLLLALMALFRTPAGRDRWLLRAPLGLYAGWLTAASWVSVALVGAGFGIGLGSYGWALIVILAALAMSATIIFRMQPALTFGLAVVWALVAIAVKDVQTAPLVAALAGLGALLIVALLVEKTSLKG